MKKITCSLLLIVTVSVTQAQSNPRVDSVVKLVQTYFNQKSADKLYGLTGAKFQKSVSAEQFQAIAVNNLFTLGEMPAPQFISSVNGQSKYKVDFNAGTLLLYASLDSMDKLVGFLFKPYVNDEANRLTMASAGSLKNFVEATVKEYVDKKATAGLSVGILKDGQVSYYHFGEKEIGKNGSPDNKTIYEIGSITKTFTALLLADAVVRGQVKLDDPVNKYLPASIPKLVFEGTPVTLKMLANHTSGLPRMSDNFDTVATDENDPYKQYGEKELTAFLSTYKLAQKPGTAYEYSNLGTATLGWILERVTKKSFAKLVTDKITNQLRMTQTGQHVAGANKARFPNGYNDQGEITSHWNFDVYAPAGALHSTIADMMLYAKAVMNNTPLSLAKAIKLTKATTFTDGVNNLGLGWHFIKPGKDELIFHNGGTYGFSSYMAINPRNKSAVIVLSNSGISVDAIGNQMMMALEN